MTYSSIQRKPCRCGCGKPPTIGFAGYNVACRPDLKKDKKKKFIGKKLNTAARSIQSQLRKDIYKNGKDEDAERAIKLHQWFELIRSKLTGMCHCGCGKPSSRDDNKYYRHSCAHIFPKKLFPSIMFHPDNYVERSFWGGCHTNMDEGGIDNWKNFADWEDIKRKFFILSPLIPEEEKSHKFYRLLEALVHQSVSNHNSQYSI